MNHLFLTLSLMLSAPALCGQVADFASLRVSGASGQVEYERVDFSSEHLTLHFEAGQRFVTLPGILEGQSGVFILDTGAPGLIVNAIPQAACAEAEVATGKSTTVGCVQVKSLSFGPVHQREVESYVMDLDHLSYHGKEPLLGIIGYQQLANLRLEINYQEGTLKFLKEAQLTDAGMPVPIHWHGHLPTIKTRLEGVSTRLAFDTGATINALNKRTYRRLQRTGRLDAPSRILIRGLDAKVHLAPRHRVRLVEIREANWLNQSFAVSDFSAFRERGRALHGLLGRAWAAGRTITLDYSKSRLYVR